ncbi:glycosyl transferase family group 2-domain-containing protein [Chytriomyces sp. MP71]|nr:glycosyl transferase family group 2-domain-containing protein [Chytriomyces sp. MP71]
MSSAWDDDGSEMSGQGVQFNTATGAVTGVAAAAPGLSPQPATETVAEEGVEVDFADSEVGTSVGSPFVFSRREEEDVRVAGPVAAAAPPKAVVAPSSQQHKKFVSSPLKDSSAYDIHPDSVQPPPQPIPIPANAQSELKPGASYAFTQSLSRNKNGQPPIRTNIGNTKAVMALLSEFWIFNMFFLFGAMYFMTFYLGKLQSYDDYELWNVGCYWKIGWLLPLPYTLICLFGLILPYRTPKFLDYAREGIKKRRLDNLYIVTVTKGDNREAVYRAWQAHRHLEAFHPAVRVHVLTDEPYFFEGINCYTCPRAFTTGNSKYKARALEWYRQTMRFTEHDWILHLDEESVIDDESVKRILEFIWYEKDYHFGQGVILYNQYRYWTNWVYTVADAIRVGDDLARFHLQYTFFHRPIFGAHGSFLLTNGLVENAVTWDLGSLTEDYQFAMKAWDRGFRCGKVCALVREQSPMDIMGFMKQRRRWFVGIRRLPNFLPKLWAFFWALGIISLYCTIASIPLGFVYKYTTPRWFGFLKDLSFVTFVYLYILGIFVQDIDKGVNPLIVFLRIPATMVIQYICVVMEGCAVMYGILFPPADFDVIKK